MSSKNGSVLISVYEVGEHDLRVPEVKAGDILVSSSASKLTPGNLVLVAIVDIVCRFIGRLVSADGRYVQFTSPEGDDFKFLQSEVEQIAPVLLHHRRGGLTVAAASINHAIGDSLSLSVAITERQVISNERSRDRAGNRGSVGGIFPTRRAGGGQPGEGHAETDGDRAPEEASATGRRSRGRRALQLGAVVPGDGALRVSH